MKSGERESVWGWILPALEGKCEDCWRRLRPSQDLPARSSISSIPSSPRGVQDAISAIQPEHLKKPRPRSPFLHESASFLPTFSWRLALRGPCSEPFLHFRARSSSCRQCGRALVSRDSRDRGICGPCDREGSP